MGYGYGKEIKFKDMKNLNKKDCFILGFLSAVTIILIALHVLIPNKPLGNCTVTNPDGTDTIYKNCLVNIVVTQEQGNFFKYKSFKFIRGLND